MSKDTAGETFHKEKHLQDLACSLVSKIENDATSTHFSIESNPFLIPSSSRFPTALQQLNAPPNGTDTEITEKTSRLLRKVKPRHYNDEFVSSDCISRSLWLKADEDLTLKNLDIIANRLATLDEEKYFEAKLRDADFILHKCLLPMSFPWSQYHHYSEVCKSHPRDIDEIPEILVRQDFSNDPFDDGPFGYGKFEVGKTSKSLLSSERPLGIRAATRRTEDPGVIELTIVQNISSQCDNDHPSLSLQESFKDGSYDKSIEDSTWRSVRKRTSAVGEQKCSESTTNLSERCFHLYQAEKRAKVENASGIVKKKYISVRFGGVSSRKSILKADIKPWTGLNICNSSSSTLSQVLAPALLVKIQLPPEVHLGRSLPPSLTESNAKILGSYDIAFGTTSSEQMPKSCHRFKRAYSGRTRLMWTKASFGGNSEMDLVGMKQRIQFSSLLTSDRIEPTSLHRPNDVNLSVRVNGNRLTCKEHTLENRQTLVEQHNANEMETVASASGLRGKTIADAIAVACGTFSFPSNEKNTEKILNSEGNRTSPKCFLKNERLIKNIIQSRQKHTVSKKRGSKAGVTIIASDSNGRAAKTPLITPPRFECLPALDSVIRVVCTMPGTLAPCYLPEIFALDAAASDLAKCSVCFLSSDNETVKTCLTCGVAVHLSCCFSKGVSLEEGNAWLCAVCNSPYDGKLSSSRKRKSKTPRRYRDDTEEEEDPTHATDAGGSTKCQICGHYGGAMSPLDESNSAFVHEVCRIWTRMKSIAISKNPNETSNKPKFAMTCAICGVNECDANMKKFVRCVVAGCQVSFHPMCGLLASKIASSEAVQSEMPLDTLERMKMLDTQLCMQYTLSMMKCTVGSPRNSMTSALPIAFCGLHNPIRDISFFGCPPCANILGESMRIPEASIFVKKK